MTNNILITGGAGYIGSILTEQLIRSSDDYHVTVVDNFMWGQTSLNHLCYNQRLTIIKGDARDIRLMGDLLRRCDVFIPLAALVGAPLCSARQDDAVTTNLLAIGHAIQYLSQSQRVIYPNTNSGYGSVPVGECTEETPFNAVSLYGKTKTDAEKQVLSRLNSVVFRLATVFGMSPRMRLDLLVNDFTHRAVMDGFMILYEPHFMRNYIHVRDVARVFMHEIGRAHV